jgi:enamine deaminase RidA (YjgF/YER057c/UK114 family)
MLSAKLTGPLGAYVEASEVGSLLFLSGMLPVVDGKLSFTGRLGENLFVEQGREAVRIAAMNAWRSRSNISATWIA